MSMEQNILKEKIYSHPRKIRFKDLIFDFSFNHFTFLMINENFAQNRIFFFKEKSKDS